MLLVAVQEVFLEMSVERPGHHLLHHLAEDRQQCNRPVLGLISLLSIILMKGDDLRKLPQVRVLPLLQ